MGSFSSNPLVPLLIIVVIALAIYIIAARKRATYQREVVGKIRAIIKQPSGYPLKKIVSITPDGWVKVEGGDYKLPDTEEQKKAFEEAFEEVHGKELSELNAEERLQYFGERIIIPSAMEWGLYPSRPFLGMGWTQVPIREQEWFANDPTPITWLGHKEPRVTATISQAHTLQGDALHAGNRAKELESKSRQWMEAFRQIPSKTILYVMGAGAIVLLIIILVTINGGSLPLPGK